MIIDHQWHWMDPDVFQALLRRDKPPRVEPGGPFEYVFELADGVRVPMPPDLVLDLDERLRMAGDNGIDAVVCSPTFVAEALHLEPGEAAELLQLANSAMARAQRAHPEQLAGLAFLPLQSPDHALSVLQAAVDDGLRGVSILASIDGRPVATEETLPVFQRIAELDLPVFLHPAVRSNTSSQGRGMPAEIGIGWMYHTALAALNLIESGTLDSCPELTVVHPHLGGVLPYIRGRVDDTRRGERPLSEYLRRNFYTDTVNSTPGALEFAIAAYGLDRVLFATDYPFVPMAAGVEYVRANADEKSANAIFANRLPGLLGAS